jgi:L-Ala-D/L-Glu epimerase
MKIVEAQIHLLGIPFNFSFGHFLKVRVYSDSFVVALTADSGIKGYGEGVARSYVTGETVKKSVKHIEKVLLPTIMQREMKEIDISLGTHEALEHIYRSLPDEKEQGIIAWNAAKASVELAIIDCMLKRREKPLGSILPPQTESVAYSGVFSSGKHKSTVELAQRFRELGIKYVKIKVGKGHDWERIAAVRDIMGPSASIRLDANAAFSVKEAVRFLESVEEFNIDCMEQPVKRGDPMEMAAVREASSVPIMADESIVTQEDARILLENNACDYFNLRVAKCGGLYNTLAIAEMARQQGVKIQIGCMVGETAILSAVGRHAAAYLPDTRFVEGSYGAQLLAKDISEENIVFGPGGDAPVLTGPGLGVTIKDEILNKYTSKMHRVS